MSLLPLITLKVSLWKDHRKQREAIQYDYANTRSQKRSFYQQKVISLIPCTGRTGMRWMGRQQNFASMGVQEGYFIPFNIIQGKCCRNPHISIEPRMWFDKGEGFGYPQHESIYCYKSMIHARIFIFAFFWYFMGLF